MDHNHSNHTGRHHRTMQEAFGPYTSSSLYIEEDRAFDFQDKIAMAACFVMFVAFIAISFLFN